MKTARLRFEVAFAQQAGYGVHVLFDLVQGELFNVIFQMRHVSHLT
jgi:hypothetical protein